jgi:hypothetical protein
VAGYSTLSGKGIFNGHDLDRAAHRRAGDAAVADGPQVLVVVDIGEEEIGAADDVPVLGTDRRVHLLRTLLARRAPAACARRVSFGRINRTHRTYNVT